MIKELFLRSKSSLKLKLLAFQVLAALLAFALFFGVNRTGQYAVERFYMSPESVSARSASLYASLSAYVKNYQLSGENAAALNRWARAKGFVLVQAYPLSGVSQPYSGMRPIYDSQYGKLYPLRFADGVYYVSIEDRSAQRELGIYRFVAIVLSALSYGAVQLAFTGRLTRRMLRLSRETAEIGAGDLESPITVDSTDEIAMLASDIDAMRHSLIERMSNERRAWEANAELITAISHDIRTPMTSLIGYLGFLQDRPVSEAERLQFTRSAYGKAMELKSLTDELFRYFLVFGRAEPAMDIDAYDAPLLLGQLLGEAEFDLTDSGFRVETASADDAGFIRVDPLYLKRVLDNLVSNIKKYAEPGEPVQIRSERCGGKWRVRFANAVGPRSQLVESSKIGTRTCEKILSHLGGSFHTENDGKRFTADFALPVRDGPDEQA